MTPRDLPQNYYYGGGGDTFVSGPALCLFLLCAFLILIVPRRRMIAPFLIASLLIPMGNEIVVAGMHWMLFRCLLLVGLLRVFWARYVSRSERPLGRLNPVDWAMTLWAISNAVTYTIDWGAAAAAFNRMGFLFATLGAYFLLRYLIRDMNDVTYTIRILALVCVLVGPLMLLEHVTRNNYYFSVFGGGTQAELLREGKFRAQGPFAHPSIAGTFGAVLLPLFVGLWQLDRKYRVWAFSGSVACLAMVFASNSGTPANTLAVGIAALCFWPFRRNMRFFRWAAVAMLLVLQMVMKADVWFLIGRVSAFTGGTGWHRAELINQFIHHFGDWWLVGTRDNAYWGIDMWDVDNAYVGAGIYGGLITCVLFIAILVYAYKKLGAARRAAAGSLRNEKFIWALGAVLFANTMGYFGIVYFDQSVNMWYAFLAMICASTAGVTSESQPAQASAQPEEYDAILENLPAT